MLENKKAIYQANYFYLNGKKRFDIWSQKEVDDKDTMQVKGELSYKSDYFNNNSNYNTELLKLIQELRSKHVGLTNLYVMQNGRILDSFRISKVDKACFKNWDQVVEKIINRERS